MTAAVTLFDVVEPPKPEHYRGWAVWWDQGHYEHGIVYRATKWRAKSPARLAAVRLVYERGGKVYLAPGQANGGKAIPRGTIPIIDGSGYSADEWKALSLADNQLALLAGWDIEQLTTQLDELAAVNFDIEAIGFDQAALDALASGDDPEGGAGGGRDPTGELDDSQFSHADQFAVIVRCKDEAEQEARFNRLRDEFGPDNVKVVVV